MIAVQLGYIFYLTLIRPIKGFVYHFIDMLGEISVLVFQAAIVAFAFKSSDY